MEEEREKPPSLVFSSVGHACEFIERHEIESETRFVISRESKDFNKIDENTNGGTKIFWELKESIGRGSDIPFDGIPFQIVGFQLRQCLHGPERHRKEKSAYKSKQKSTGSKKRQLLQPSKQKDCPAFVSLRAVLKFPEFKIEENSTSWRKKQVSRLLREKLSDEGEILQKEVKIYVSISDLSDHRNHLTGEFSGLSNPVDKIVISKIHALVHEGVRTVDEMKRHLRIFVRDNVPLGKSISKFNRRYYPTNKDIRNHIYRALQISQFSTEDQENVVHMVDDWRAAKPDDHFYLRPNFAEEEESSETSTGPFLFVHQAEWQQKLLQKYGNEICLLDATYNTSKYDVPLFFICVNTNVGFSIVASFVVANENTGLIEEGLQIIKEWNPDWRPEYFMTDFDEREISAIENTFEGCQSLLCDFHREQAWTRWTKDGKHGLYTAQNEVLEMLRRIANSATEEKYKANVEDLKKSALWKKNTQLQRWFEGRWLSNAKRWVRCFRNSLVNIRVSTTNGLERQHHELKKTYLAKHIDGTLSSTLSVLISNFLPESYKRYIQYNIESMNEYKRYSPQVPEFLTNRPRFFVEHLVKRIPPKCPYLPEAAITSLPNGEFQVTSTDGENSYTVNLDNPMPSCSCLDWKKFHLPCKHMLNIFFHYPGYSWEFLQPEYTDCPHFNLDRDILQKAQFSEVFDCRTEGEQSTSDDNTTVTVDSDMVEAENTTVAADINVVEAENTQKAEKQKPRSSKFNLKLQCIQLLRSLSSSIYIVPDQEKLLPVQETLQESLCLLEALIPKERGLPLRTSKSRLKRLYRTRYRSLPLRRKRRKQNRQEGIKSTPGPKKPRKSRVRTVKVERSEKPHSDESKVEEEVKTIEDNDPCVLDTGLRSILKEGGRNSTTKKRVHFSELCSSYQCNKDDALKEVTKIWSLERGVGYFVAKVGDFNVTDTDIRSLHGTRWLTDQVMDAYLAFIVQREREKGNLVTHYPSQTMRSIVEGTFSVQKCRRRLKLWEFSTIIGAVCQNYHWTLVIIDSRNRILTFLNPKHEGRSQLDEIKKNWCSYIKERRQAYKELEAEDDNWSVKTLKHSKQRDAFNCGVYCLMFAERYFLKELLTNITDHCLSRARKEIATTLLTYHVSQDTCPTCGFTTKEEVQIRCTNCARYFHRREACIGPENVDRKSFKCQICTSRPVKCTKRKMDTCRDGEADMNENLTKVTSTMNKKVHTIEDDGITKLGINKIEVTAASPNSFCADGNENTNPVELLWSLKKDFCIPVAQVCGKLVTDEDIRSLRDNECLTDRVLDCYLSQLVSVHNGLGRKVVYYNQTKMTGIINCSYKIPEVSDCSESDFDADVILGIYHRYYHWTLLIVEVKKEILYFYNPCGERKTEMRKILSSWRKYEKEYREKINVQRKLFDWRITSTPHTHQRDAFSCGVFCLMFAEKHLSGDLKCLMTVTSADLKHMRKAVALKLMEGKVFLTECCPKCAKSIEGDESIKCSTCRRSFHFKPFCIEEDLADIKEAEHFKCRLCRINFWNEEESHYNLRKHPLKKRKRSSFLYSNIHGRYQQETRGDQDKDKKIEATETISGDAVIGRPDGYDDTNPPSSLLVDEATETISGDAVIGRPDGYDDTNLPSSLLVDEATETISGDAVIGRPDGYDDTNPPSSLLVDEATETISGDAVIGRPDGYDDTNPPSSLLVDEATETISGDAVIGRPDGYDDTNPPSSLLVDEATETISGVAVIGRLDCYDDTNPSFRHGSTSHSELNMEFIAKHVNNIVNTLSEMMNCSLTKCDEGDHKRHHDFIKSPEKTYTENYIKYYFGAKYIEPEDFEYLQEVLGERMCTNKLLPGSIFSRYSSFKNYDNEELEKIFIEYPLMGHQYFKFVILKEAVTYLVCLSTGLPYEESDKRCSETELSVSKHKCTT